MSTSKMSKKRKTKEQKIISQLRRELKKKATFEPSQEANYSAPVIQKNIINVQKKTDKSILLPNSKPIRHDLIKSLILALAVLSFELVLYWKLR